MYRWSRYVAYLTQLVQHAQRAILTQDGRRRADLLTLGYRRDSVEACISNTHPNTVLTSMLTSPAWHRILARMGAHRFYHMLRTTSYFVPLDSDDCFAQMWGEPLTDLPVLVKRKAAPVPCKRRRRRKTSRAAATPATPASTLYFRRGRLFYARAIQRYRYGIVLGLPPSHVLYTQGTLRRRTAALARTMYPLQFQRVPLWHAKPKPTRLGRWPKRLGALRPVLRSLLRRHDRFHYAAAVEACCPSMLPRGAKVADMEDVPEPAPAPAPASTQAFAAHDSVRARRMQQQLAKVRSKGEPRFYQYATSLGRVCWFVRVVLRRVVPLSLYGSAENRSVVLAAAARFVCARRGERLPLHDVLQGFRTSHCAWLGTGKGPASEHKKRTELVYETLFWLFEHFLLPLLRTTFYVTEAAAFRQRVLYFRQDLWHRVSAPLVARLRDRLFERVPNAAGAPVAQVRLLPKDTSIRPIVNLRRRTLDGVSVNAQLQTAFDVLALEAARTPRVYGAAVHGANGIYTRLRDLKASLETRFGHVPMLYMVRADIRAAFDSLDHAQLVRLVRSLLAGQGTYVVQRYMQLKPGLGRVARNAVRRAWDDEAYPSFLQTRPSARHAVLVDSVAYALTDSEQVLRQVEAHVTRSLVRFGSELYRQKTGVPQGSVLSTILCNLLLGDVERTMEVDGCLMRYTDDFLLLTPSRRAAEQFCVALHEGFPTHGCYIAPEKTLVNFDMVCGTTLVPRIAADDPVPWCGFEISPTTLCVRADPQRYPYHFGDTLTVHAGAHPGDALVHRMLHAVRARTHVLFTDTVLNTEDGAYRNLLEGFAVAAVKLHTYCRAMRPRRASPQLLLRAIEQAVRMTYPMVASRIELAAASMHLGAETSVQRVAVEWLGYFGFYQVLAPRAVYAGVSLALAARLRASRYGAARRSVGRVALAQWPLIAAELEGRF